MIQASNSQSHWRKTLLQRVTETIEKKKAKRRRRGKEQNVKWKGSEKDSILCHICNSAGFCFIFSKHVPLLTRASNSATTESLSCWRLISYFHLLKAINTHRASGRWEMHNNRGWLFRINATTAFPVFFFFFIFQVPSEKQKQSKAVDGAMDYPVCMEWPMWTESEAWRTPIVSAKAKAYYNRAQTSRTQVD